MRPLPPWSDTHPPLLSSAALCCPSLAFDVALSWTSSGSLAPLCHFLACAALANVNPLTRLSHMTPFLGRNWCSRERCRLMMQHPRIDVATSSRIPQNFPRIFGESRTTRRGARAHLLRSVGTGGNVSSCMREIIAQASLNSTIN